MFSRLLLGGKVSERISFRSRAKYGVLTTRVWRSAWTKHCLDSAWTIWIVGFYAIPSHNNDKAHVELYKVYLIHWPVPLNPNGNHPVFPKLPDGTRDVDYSWKIADTWKQLEALVKKGKVKSIGVSNFSEKKLEEILPTAEIVPAVDQVCRLFIILNDIACVCITDVIDILA